jgi:hypothetical protein
MTNTDRPILHWRKYPEEQPSDFGKCIAILRSHGDLGVAEYIWCVNWDNTAKEFRDFGECSDLSNGAKVIYFIEEPYHPKDLSDTQYTIRQITKKGKLYSSIHASADAHTTLCGHEINENWYILTNEGIGVVTCEKCKEILR